MIRSHSLLASNIYGSLTFTNTHFTTHNGISGDPHFTAEDATVDLSLITAEIPSKLIHFDRYFLTSLTFNGTGTFSNNYMTANSSSEGGTLFILGESDTLRTLGDHTMELTMQGYTFQDNYCRDAQGLFYAYVQHITMDS